MFDLTSRSTRWAIAHQRKIIACAIIAVAAAFRLPRLGTVPFPLADEVFAAVDTHYLLSTGRHFTGANAGLLAHLIPALDGRYLVSLFSVGNVGDLRLVSAAFGIATVLLLIPLGAELGNATMGYLGAATLAVMPWHIYFSRVYIPGSEYLFFSCLTVVLLLAGLRRHSLPLLMASVVTAAATIYLYPVSIVTTPVVSLGALLFRFSEARRLRLHQLLIPMALAALILAPYIAGHLESADPTVANANSVVESKMIWNHGLTQADTVLLFLRNWATYLWPQFILLHGDPNPTQSIQTMGEAGWVIGFLGLIGILVGIAKATRLHLVLFFWLLTYPIADALTAFDATGNSLRGLFGAVVWALLAAIGVLWLLEAAHSKSRLAIAGLVTAAIVVQCLAFVSFYLGPYAKRYEYLFETGYERVYQVLKLRGLADVPLTLHAGYQRDAMLQYFSGYRLLASKSVLACFDLPDEVIHNTVLPRVFVVRDDPGFSTVPHCIHQDLVARDRSSLAQGLEGRGKIVPKLEVLDHFTTDPSGRYQTAIFYAHS